MQFKARIPWYPGEHRRIPWYPREYRADSIKRECILHCIATGSTYNGYTRPQLVLRRLNVLYRYGNLGILLDMFCDPGFVDCLAIECRTFVVSLLYTIMFCLDIRCNNFKIEINQSLKQKSELRIRILIQTTVIIICKI